jgi:hypothetical protein
MTRSLNRVYTSAECILYKVGVHEVVVTYKGQKIDTERKLIHVKSSRISNIATYINREYKNFVGRSTYQRKIGQHPIGLECTVLQKHMFNIEIECLDKFINAVNVESIMVLVIPQNAVYFLQILPGTTDNKITLTFR